MGRSRGAYGPDFKVLRPDLEAGRKACDEPVPYAEWADEAPLHEIPPDSGDEFELEIFVWVDPEL